MDSATFSRVSAVRAREGGIFDAELSSEWTFAGKPNGGYLLSLLGRAASSLTDASHVVAASAHYLRAPDPGPVEIDGAVLNRGRSINQVRTRLSQGGRSCVEALLGTGRPDPSATPRWDGGVVEVDGVPFEDGVRMEPVTPEGYPVPILNHVDLRLDPVSNGSMRGRPTGRGQLRGWLKLLGQDGFDPISLLYAMDAFPPASFDTAVGAWISTVQMTGYIRGLPAPGPVRIISSARLVDAQWLDQTCEVRDVTGRLVAHATQLARTLG